MKEVFLVIGGVYGCLSVIFGAFGAHALKKKLTEEQQKSFETGVRYQMYHALILIVSAIVFPFREVSQEITGWCFVIGVLLFSFSIYGLVLSDAQGKKMRFLGPVTPLGGLILVIGWILFIINIAEIATYLNPTQ